MVWEKSKARLHSPFGLIGDRLWVREGYVPRYFEDFPFVRAKHGYRADWTLDAADVCPEPKWVAAQQMPRRDSRITLETTDIRVERLQEISEEDARAEGCKPRNIEVRGGIARTSLLDFAERWNAIQSKRKKASRVPWSANPWVWAVTFKRLEDANAE
jgi:hypothetical protein